MNCSILTPPPHPPYPGAPFAGVGRGTKLFCELRLLCVDLDPDPGELSSCTWTPYPIAGVPGPHFGCHTDTVALQRYTDAVALPYPPDPHPLKKVGCKWAMSNGYSAHIYPRSCKWGGV